MIEPLIRSTVTDVSAHAQHTYIRWFISGIEQTTVNEPGTARELAEHVRVLCEAQSCELEQRGYYVSTAILGYLSLIDGDNHLAIDYFSTCTQSLQTEDIGLRTRSIFRMSLAYAKLGKVKEARSSLRQALADEGIISRSEKLFLARTILFALNEFYGNLTEAIIYARKIVLTHHLINYPFEWCTTLIGYASIVRTISPPEYRKTLHRIATLSSTMRTPLVNTFLDEYCAYRVFSDTLSRQSYDRLQELSEWYLSNKLFRRASYSVSTLLWFSMKKPFAEQFDVLRKRAVSLLRKGRSIEATRYFYRADFLMTLHRGDIPTAKRTLRKFDALLSSNDLSERMSYEIQGFIAFAYERLQNFDKSIELWQKIVHKSFTTHQGLLDSTGIFELAYAQLADQRWVDVLTTYNDTRIPSRLFQSDKDLFSRSYSQIKTSFALRHDEAFEADLIEIDNAIKLLATSQSIYTLQALIASKRRLLNQLLAEKSAVSPQLSAVVHDLRNMLSSLRMISLIQSGKGVRNSTIKVLEAALGTIRWLRNSLESSRVFTDSKLEEVSTFQSSDDIITSAISVCLPVARKRNLRIIYHSSPNAVQLTDYEARLYRCIALNAINNAVRHSPSNNIIHVGTALVNSRFVFYAKNPTDTRDISVLAPFNSESFDKNQAEILDILSNTALHGLGSTIIRCFADMLNASTIASIRSGCFWLAIALPPR